jgi:hypothetical protein
MAPIAVDNTQPASQEVDISSLKAALAQVDRSKVDLTLPPENTLRRYQKAGIDLSNGYPYFPPKPDFVQDVEKIRTDLRTYVDPGTRADPEKKALFGAAKEVRNLGTHIGVSTNKPSGTLSWAGVRLELMTLDRDCWPAAQGPDRPAEG